MLQVAEGIRITHRKETHVVAVTKRVRERQRVERSAPIRLPPFLSWRRSLVAVINYFLPFPLPPCSFRSIALAVHQRTHPVIVEAVGLPEIHNVEFYPSVGGGVSDTEIKPLVMPEGMQIVVQEEIILLDGKILVPRIAVLDPVGHEQISRLKVRVENQAVGRKNPREPVLVLVVVHATGFCVFAPSSCFELEDLVSFALVRAGGENRTEFLVGFSFVVGGGVVGGDGGGGGGGRLGR